jgi:hypothetical protein
MVGLGELGVGGARSPTQKQGSWPRCTESQEATYKLGVRGELDNRFAYLFNGMDVHGFIERSRSWCLELLAVEQTCGPSSALDE